MGFSGTNGRKTTEKNIEKFTVKHFTNLISFNFRWNKQKHMYCYPNNNKLLKDKDKIIKAVREK